MDGEKLLHSTKNTWVSPSWQMPTITLWFTSKVIPIINDKQTMVGNHGIQLVQRPPLAQNVQAQQLATVT